MERAAGFLYVLMKTQFLHIDTVAPYAANTTNSIAKRCVSYLLSVFNHRSSFTRYFRLKEQKLNPPHVFDFHRAASRALVKVYGEVDEAKGDSVETIAMKNNIRKKWYSQAEPPSTASTALLSQCSSEQRRQMCASAAVRLQCLIAEKVIEPSAQAIPDEPIASVKWDHSAMLSEDPTDQVHDSLGPDASIPEAGQAAAIEHDHWPPDGTACPTTANPLACTDGATAAATTQGAEHHKVTTKALATHPSKFRPSIFLKNDRQCVIKCGICGLAMFLTASAKKSNVASTYLATDNFKTHFLTHVSVSAGGQQVIIFISVFVTYCTTYFI